MFLSEVRNYLWLIVLLLAWPASFVCAQNNSDQAALEFLNSESSREKIDALLNEMLLWPEAGNLENKKNQLLPRLLEKGENMDSLALRAYFYQTLTIAYYRALGDLEGAREMIEKEIEVLKKYDPPYRSLPQARSRLMFVLADLNEKEKAFEVSLQVKKDLEKIEENFSKSFLLRQLCVFYHRISDHDHAAEACLQAIAYNESEGINMLMGSLYETLALVAETKSSGLDSVLSLRQKAIYYNLKSGDSLDLRVSYRNLARSFESADQADSAEFYYQKTFELYDHHPYYLGWVNDQQAYGHFLLKQGKVQPVKSILDTLSTVVNTNLTDHINSQTSLATLQMQYYAFTGQYEKFTKSSHSRDSLNNLDYEKKTIEAREEMMTRYETEKKESENRFLKAENQSRSRDIINLTILCLLLLALAILLIQRRSKDRKILAQQIEFSRIEATSMKKRIAEIKSDLEERVKQVLVQQARNTELNALIEELHTIADSSHVKQKASQMRQHLKLRMEEETLSEIEDKMEQLHPELFSFLKEKIDPSKRNELISTAMYFMGYETRDIASLLQRTEKAVRSMRYRVRKKLNLSDSEDMLLFLKQKQEELA